MQQKGIAKDTAVLRTLINYEAQNFATKRLLRDKDLIDRDTTPTVGVTASPLDHDLFVWHANIRGPAGTLYEGGIFHLEMKIPQRYPHDPPTIKLFTRVPHPNVQDQVVCLDMLDPNQKGEPTGWTSAFTLQSVLIQLQAFLFEEFIGGDKQTQTQRQESIKQAVKEANEFKCSTQNCKHGGKLSLWPKFNESEADLKAFINLKSSSELIESDFVCFHTRLPYRQLNTITIESNTNIKRESCLGIMLQVTKVPRTGAIKAAIASLDYISIKAFLNEGIRHDSTKNKYQFWLPLYFGKKDDKQRVLHLLKKSVSMIITNSTRRFKPEYIMELFPRLTQNIGFGMMDQRIYPSIKSIRILSQIHALWLVCMEEWPQLHSISDNIVKKFIENPVERDKNHTPNLGVLFNLLYVSNIFTFNDLVTCYTEEQLDRQVFWIFKELPELADEAKESRISSAKRAEISFKQQRTPFQMSCYQYLYLSICKKPFKSTQELLAKYEDNFCLLTTGQENALQAKIFEIQKTVINYDSFYDFIQLPRKSEEELDLQLRQSIQNSKAKSYHGTLEEINKVPPKDEQIKEYNRKFKQLQDLYEIQDEVKQNQHSYQIKLKNQLSENDWKQILIERWSWIEDELYWNSDTTPTQLAKLSNSRLMYGSGNKPIDRLYTKIQNQKNVYQTYVHMEAAQTPFPEQSWEQLFMKLDFEEQLLQIDINPDFKIFYQKLAIICDKVTDLIVPLVSVDHLQSGYNYIKGTLEKLTNLERLTFTIPLTVPQSNLPKKAAKSIFKGMNNLSKKQNKLNQLIYHKIQFQGNENEIIDCLFTPLLNYLEQIQLFQIEDTVLLAYNNSSKVVGGLITNMKNLQYLILRKCINNVDQAKSIQDGLMRAKQLKYLDISSNSKITQQGLAGIIYNISFTPKLHFLNLANCGGDKFGRLLSENLEKLIRITGSLQILDLSSCLNFVPELTIEFYKALGENRSLKAINFNNCNGSFNYEYLGKSIAFNAKNGGKLTFIGLKKMINAFSDLCTVYINMWISKQHHEQWYGDEVKAQHMNYMETQTEFYCQLQSIDIESGLFQSHFINQYSQSIKGLLQRMSSVNIRDCRSDFRDMNLLKYCLEEQSKLQILELSNNSIDKDGAKILASILISNQSINVIDISNNNLGVSGGQSIAQSLKSNKALKTMIIFDNMIGFDGAKAFGEALKVNSTLETLDIGMNRIRNKGLYEITEGLSLNKKSNLKSLGIRCNFITDEGLTNLLTKSSLQEIYVKHNQINDFSLFQIKKFYDECKCTCKIDLFHKFQYIQENRIERTIWVSPQFGQAELIQFFEKNDIGVTFDCRLRKGIKYPNRSAQENNFNFVEFTNENSVKKALVIAATSQAVINGQGFRIYKAGTGTFIYSRKSKKQKIAEASATNILNKRISKAQQQRQERQKQYEQRKKEREERQNQFEQRQKEREQRQRQYEQRKKEREERQKQSEQRQKEREQRQRQYEQRNKGREERRKQSEQRKLNSDNRDRRDNRQDHCYDRDNRDNRDRRDNWDIRDQRDGRDDQDRRAFQDRPNRRDYCYDRTRQNNREGNDNWGIRDQRAGRDFQDRRGYRDRERRDDCDGQDNGDKHNGRARRAWD